MTIGISEITDLGTVYEEEIQIDNKLISIPRPLGSTNNNTAANLFGKVRKITISGSHSGDGYAGGTAELKIKAFIDDVETWIDANVQTTATFTDSFSHTHTVLCTVFRWARAPPGNRILYVMILVEGSAVAAFNK